MMQQINYQIYGKLVVNSNNPLLGDSFQTRFVPGEFVSGVFGSGFRLGFLGFGL